MSKTRGRNIVSPVAEVGRTVVALSFVSFDARARARPPLSALASGGFGVGAMLDYCQIVNRRVVGIGAAAALAFLSVLAARGQQPGPAPQDAFATVNGIRLHYVDWGGNGETLLFLMPNGGNVVRQFGALAPQFTSQFHGVGLTRRGLVPSEKPVSGYDTATLVHDIVTFLDVLGIQRVNVAGHSVAGAEMTQLAAEHPERVSKLVYLDAANDY